MTILVSYVIIDTNEKCTKEELLLPYNMKPPNNADVIIVIGDTICKDSK